MWIRQSKSSDLQALPDIWLRAVRATHTFLTESDIEGLLPPVESYLAGPNHGLWTLCIAETEPVGFMGLVDGRIESLFAAPEHSRRGAGTLLLEHARRLGGPLRVDVNEQNAAAIVFYEANGFHMIGRSPVDEDGRPFPLLHMREASR